MTDGETCSCTIFCVECRLKSKLFEIQMILDRAGMELEPAKERRPDLMEKRTSRVTEGSSQQPLTASGSARAQRECPVCPAASTVEHTMCQVVVNVRSAETPWTSRRLQRVCACTDQRLHAGCYRRLGVCRGEIPCAQTSELSSGTVSRGDRTTPEQAPASRRKRMESSRGRD
jgi:hypothetical protein